MNKKATKPLRNKEDVQKSNDEHIDQDFPGFPHPPSKKEVISNGSANAFEGTEHIREDHDTEEEDNDRGSDKY